MFLKELEIVPRANALTRGASKYKAVTPRTTIRPHRRGIPHIDMPHAALFYLWTHGLCLCLCLSLSVSLMLLIELLDIVGGLGLFQTCVRWILNIVLHALTHFCTRSLKAGS